MCTVLTGVNSRDVLRAAAPFQFSGVGIFSIEVRERKSSSFDPLRVARCLIVPKPGLQELLSKEAPAMKAKARTGLGLTASSWK